MFLQRFYQRIVRISLLLLSQLLQQKLGFDQDKYSKFQVKHHRNQVYNSTRQYIHQLQQIPYFQAIIFYKYQQLHHDVSAKNEQQPNIINLRYYLIICDCIPLSLLHHSFYEQYGKGFCFIIHIQVLSKPKVLTSLFASSQLQRAQRQHDLYKCKSFLQSLFFIISSQIKIAFLFRQFNDIFVSIFIQRRFYQHNVLQILIKQSLTYSHHYGNCNKHAIKKFHPLHLEKQSHLIDTFFHILNELLHQPNLCFLCNLLREESYSRPIYLFLKKNFCFIFYFFILKISSLIF
ncbi:hypothetical protein TTHERM_000112419 (macronuclear) [Tetrahymena thermophila SB210]|uniref:Transmembrane protein n=1 Tax=Tetrahymena thermophila (strain SB210) TaxID=312017 RepID=W7XJP7_TETTS|nr:hypothetical protein TTHERM_000112419 [Tetrahymena thermophila SB210]EWS75766.1 hypothetical protein TTHERM_000112419 [Tetrahymena thermophila SB210]|eukprot:XP_012651688.1 hypothetical protein TTHERM_000112419 [Tetrahymena thermophila SB210]